MNRMQSLLRLASLLLLFPLTGCGQQKRANPAVYPATLTPYQVVIADLAATTVRQGTFTGSKVFVVSDACPSLDGRHVDFPFPVGEELRTALLRENADSRALNLSEISSEHSKIGAAESIFVPSSKADYEVEIDILCRVQFWRAGYSQDAQAAIIYFSYGTGLAVGEGTYIIRKTAKGWIIQNSGELFYASRG